ncbi:hypothetical protein BW721_05870 [Jeotgalibaca sp. PTS2502]|nr:hypothetical protein BW721_05870 [Jeotgalibaca sp. PTS2502]
MQNFSYSLSSNLVSLVISTLVIFVVPKLIGVTAYGYWQLYLFYSSYIGFLHFGLNDGIYLRYGGEEYKNLNKSVFFSQFYFLFISQLAFGLIFYIFSCFFIENLDRMFVFQMLGIQTLFVNTRYMLLYILQSTNRIKEYSFITISDRLIYLVVIILIVTNKSANFRNLILSDLIGKGFSLIYSMFICRDIISIRSNVFTNVFQEIKINIKIGIRLMFANIANMFLIGVVRLGIERSWNVEVFGQISLTLSISNMFMVFINALGLVVYPMLRRVEIDRLSILYLNLRDGLMILMLGILVFYIPIKSFMLYWLPQYSEGLKYMGVLFPIIIFESKMTLLINSFMKTLRLENHILKINISVLLFSIFLTILTTSVFKNLTGAILSITFVIAIRAIIAELILTKILNVSVLRDIIIELILIAVFIVGAWSLENIFALIIYLIFYFIYIYNKKSELKNITLFIYGLVKQ